MSKNKFYVAMACAILAFAGCAEDDMSGGNVRPAHPGEEIVFGGTLDPKSTRTVYGDKQEGYTEVKWVAGDGVRIYCAEALYQDAEGNDIMQDGSTDASPIYQKYCEYTVTDGVTDLGGVIDDKEQLTHSTGLKLSGEGFGLRWGGNGTHKFYAVYPSKAQLSGKDQEAANTLKIEGNKLTALLSNMQGASDASNSIYMVDNGNVTYYPAMRNAYMTAYKPSTPVSNLSLTFEPIVTAVEVTLQNNTKYIENGVETNQDLELEMVTFSHPTAPLCGVFTADLETKMVTNTNADASYRTVSVPTKMSGELASANGNLILKSGKTVTVTAFMALHQNADLDQIKVSILANGQFKTATLASTSDIKIVQAKRKNFISTVNIGYTTEVAVDYSHWVTDLKTVAPTTKLSALSIPGAGGATSCSIEDNASREQTLDIPGLWAQGVRCFEFMVDNASDFGNQNVYCNGTSTGTKLKDALDAVSSLIASSKEFGVVIITYQEEDYNKYERNAGDDGFGGRFQTFWNGYSYTGVTKKLFNSNLTLKDAEGCLFCIGRPVSAGLDPGWYTGVADNDGNSSANNFADGTVLNILGWGNNPDQWYARGYGGLKTTSSSSEESKTITSGVSDRPYCVSADKYIDPSNTTKTSNFMYKATNQGDVAYNDISTQGWIQEWRRVVPNEETRKQYGIAALSKEAKTAGGGNASAANKYEYFYSWAPSEDEKWTDVMEALELSISDARSQYSIILNSLCGYFVDGDIESSYLPRPTFQRYCRQSRLGTYYSVFLDDKYRDLDEVSLDGSDIIFTSDGAPNIGNFGPYHPGGGFKGNIGAYADWINNKFYNLLLQKQANGELTGKSTGIVMMDRVSNDAKTNEAGYYIPRIIISMNFSATEASTLDVKTSNLEETDQVLSRKNFSVTWDK